MSCHVMSEPACSDERMRSQRRGYITRYAVIPTLAPWRHRSDAAARERGSGRPPRAPRHAPAAPAAAEWEWEWEWEWEREEDAEVAEAELPPPPSAGSAPWSGSAEPCGGVPRRAVAATKTGCGRIRDGCPSPGVGGRGRPAGSCPASGRRRPSFALGWRGCGGPAERCRPRLRRWQPATAPGPRR
jgi:hypothetical protein